MTDRASRLFVGLGGTRRATRPPRVRIDLHHPIPVWSLKVALGCLAAGCAGIVATGWLQWGVAAALVAGVVARPWGFATTALVVAIGVRLVGSDPFEPRGFALLFGLHALVALAAATGDLPWDAAVERGVVGRAARRFVGIQALAQVTAVTAAWVTGQDVSAPWLPMVGAVALAVAGWVGVTRLRRHPG
jgi:hypothetical protein